jgi:hypothetical protein
MSPLLSYGTFRVSFLLIRLPISTSARSQVYMHISLSGSVSVCLTDWLSVCLPFSLLFSLLSSLSLSLSLSLSRSPRSLFLPLSFHPFPTSLPPYPSLSLTLSLSHARTHTNTQNTRTQGFCWPVYRSEDLTSFKLHCLVGQPFVLNSSTLFADTRLLPKVSHSSSVSVFISLSASARLFPSLLMHFCRIFVLRSCIACCALCS